MNSILQKADFTIPARQSSAAIIIFIFKFANQTIRKGWAALVPIYFALRKASLVDWQIFLIASLIVIGYFLFSYLSYQRFFYYVKEDQIIIEEGIIYKHKISLPFDKIQTINFKENIIHQALGVISLQIDAAGSKKEEISLEALSKKRANEFRDYILERRKSIKTSEADDTSTMPGTKVLTGGRLVLQLNPVDLFKVGISQNHLRSIAIFTVFVWNLYDQASKQLEKQFDFDGDEKLEEISNFVGQDLAGRLGIFVIVVLALSLVVSMVFTFFKHFNFQLLASEDGLKKRYGLFERREQATTFGKIQSVTWGDNPLRKIFGLFVMRLYPASSGELNRKKSIHIPGCYQPEIDDLIHEIYGPQQAINYTIHKKSKLFVFRGLVLFAILPAVLLTTLVSIQYGLAGLYALLWIPVCYTLLVVHYNKWNLFMSEEIIKIQSGIFSHQNKMIQIRKVQAVGLSQSPYQQRKNLATVTLYSAGRNIAIDFLPVGLAWQLNNYMLYKIESSHQSWM